MELFRIYNSIDSTNKEASRLLASQVPLHETVILARHQTDGKGQYGRKWESQPDAHLAMSLILQPSSMKASDLPLLSMQISLAIVKVLKSLDQAILPLIKWPNDIYANQKKLAGILIENVLSATRVQHCIIGIGMNVNEKEFSAEAPNAISLFQITGKTFDVMDIAKLIRQFAMEMLHTPFELWKKEYDQYVFGSGTLHAFERNGEIINAVMSGISEEGKLKLVNNQGKTETYYTHEIKWLI